ncbi:hypothetical protein LCM20_08315 [Halobacillus litoralis]|uniref:glycoside hydrolase family 38 N-terminal domain-containing protein n=1 Tax=Halobacillus litoralis TaxID=45668 RepID=UPI001CD20A61|nr:glycoside hydrolase family 38 C-terminal domain-containing protein [Halobacillus litoralis]MCA0970587.1 hypothetical protein [Halobacillus litoralis]
MNHSPKTCHIVFQTHWDREWYLPFETFRHRFIHVMERVMSGLEKGELQQFILDGQLAAIEDFFEVCSPSQKQRALKLLKEEKLVVGPWYVLADEFLVSGESLWRNLEIGLEMAGSYSRSQKVGYLPDTFGHISQMPQILRSFGIDNAILWRGIQIDQSEFEWQSPNGESVYSIFLPEGYYQPVLNEEDPTSSLQSFIEKVEPYTNTSHVLLTNGGDHLMPVWENMQQRIEDANQAGLRVQASTYEKFLKHVRKESQSLLVHKGEMRSNEHIYVLPNVLSTRTYLKQQNQYVEDQLTRHVEPMLAIAGAEETDRYLEDTWKLLLKNHPHDSICGCSIDDVHKEMETRTMKLKQRMEALKKESLYHLKARDFAMTGNGGRKPFEDMSTFTVFNPHPFSYKGWVKGEVWLYEDQAFEVVGDDGSPHETVIIEKRKDRHFASPTDAFPEFKDVNVYEIAFFVPSLPALSFQTYHVESGRNHLLETTETSFIENEWMKVEIGKKGGLTVEDLSSGKLYEGFNHYTASLDAGDEYNYSPPFDDVWTEGSIIGVPKVKRSGHVQELSYEVMLSPPASLNEARTGPVQERGVISISIRIRLFKGEPIADVCVNVDNQAEDSRLRVTFPQKERVERTYSDTAFDLVERPAQKIERFDASKQKEVPVVVEPSASVVYANGFSFVHQGLQEYQVTENDEVAVTLIRGVGWLSRDDLRTRGGGAGPSFETPDAQCLGSHTFYYGFGFRPTPVEALREANQFRIKPSIMEGEGLTESLITLANPTIQVSAVRKRDRHIEIRIWNPTLEMEETNIVTEKSVMMDGELVKGPLQILPKTIKTLTLT